jgi:flagellar biosynthesis/type III secretory pathway chaperone
MSEATLASLDKKTLADFCAVLHELTALVDEENAILAIPTETLPQAMVERKETLGNRYAALTQSLRRRAAARHAAGDLDPEVLEGDIRGLVRRLKENQARLNARKAATALRVEAVMQALAERERREATGYGATGDTLPPMARRVGGLHVRA